MSPHIRITISIALLILTLSLLGIIIKDRDQLRGAYLVTPECASFNAVNVIIAFPPDIEKLSAKYHISQKEFTEIVKRGLEKALEPTGFKSEPINTQFFYHPSALSISTHFPENDSLLDPQKLTFFFVVQSNEDEAAFIISAGKYRKLPQSYSPYQNFKNMLHHEIIFWSKWNSDESAQKIQRLVEKSGCYKLF